MKPLEDVETSAQDDEAGEQDDEAREPAVEIVRTHDPIEAQITAQFLEDHGVRVDTFGGATSALPTIGMTDIRLRVAAADVERAAQVLQAMRGAVLQRHPFRDAPPDALEVEGLRAVDHAPLDDDGDDPVQAARKAPFATMLALLVPVGAGHFYAGHTAAACVFAAGIVGGLAGAMLGVGWLGYASAALIALDALLSPLAVRRANRGAVPSEGRQRGWALVALAGAYALATLAGAYGSAPAASHPRDRRARMSVG